MLHCWKSHVAGNELFLEWPILCLFFALDFILMLLTISLQFGSEGPSILEEQSMPGSSVSRVRETTADSQQRISGAALRVLEEVEESPMEDDTLAAWQQRAQQVVKCLNPEPKLKFHLFPLTQPTLKKGPTQTKLFQFSVKIF